jgi:hypothetical protein
MNRMDAIHTLVSDLQNEYSHLLFYTRQASIVGGMHAAEYREFFEKAAASELQHVLAFQDRILGLAPDIRLGGHPLAVELPRYDALRGLTPFFHPHEALDHAIQLETDVARNYTHTIRALDTPSYAAFPEATYLKIFYEEQLKDSYEDCERMRRLRANFVEQPYNRSWRDWTLKSADE